MNCKRIQIELDAFLDGELDGAKRDHVRTHLGRCERCRAELKSLQTLKTELSKLAPALADPAFEDRLVSAVLQKTDGIEKRRFYGWAAVAAALAATAILGMASTNEQIAATERQEILQESRFEFQRDQALASESDPLVGGATILPAGYAP